MRGSSRPVPTPLPRSRSRGVPIFARGRRATPGVRPRVESGTLMLIILAKNESGTLMLFVCLFVCFLA